MDNRFTFKDFVFSVLIVLVIGAVCWMSWQFGYQEKRLGDLRQQIQQLDDTQKQQLTVLAQIQNALRKGVSVNTAATSAAVDGHIRRTDPDGTIYVYYPQAPKPPRDPTDASDYSTGDWLVENLGDEPKVLTPFNVKDEVGQLAQAPVLESLLTRDPVSFEWEPWLAESYEIKPGGLQIIFKLRNGIKFSDGTPITVDDVLFSFNTIRNPDVDCAPLRTYYQSVKELKKIDDRTVEFDFSEPYFQAIDIAGGLTIIPEHVYKFAKGEDFNKRGDLLVGSGPYRLQSWDRGQQLVMVRNENYWGDRPTFDRVVLKFITNEQAALQSFQNGQLDILHPDPDQWVKFTADADFMKGITAYKYLRPDAGYTFIGYNQARPQFADKETRRALGMLLDHQAMIHTFLKDMAVEVTSPFSPITPQNDPSIKAWPYDPDAAKALLAKAGWTPGSDGVLTRNGTKFQFDLMMGTGSPLVERMVSYIKEQWESAGISVRITPFEFATLSTRLDDRNFDAVFMGWSGDIEGDPYQIWDSASIADKGSNFINFKNKESDELIEKGRRTLDTDARMKIWHQWQALIHEECPYTFLFTSYSRVFIDGRFKNTEPYKTGIVEYDWYVPAAKQKYHN